MNHQRQPVCVERDVAGRGIHPHLFGGIGIEGERRGPAWLHIHGHLRAAAPHRHDHAGQVGAVFDRVVGGSSAVAIVDSIHVVGIHVEIDPGDVGGDDVELEGRAAGRRSVSELHRDVAFERDRAAGHRLEVDAGDDDLLKDGPEVLRHVDHRAGKHRFAGDARRLDLEVVDRDAAARGGGAGPDLDGVGLVAGDVGVAGFHVRAADREVPGGRGRCRQRGGYFCDLERERLGRAAVPNAIDLFLRRGAGVARKPDPQSPLRALLP